MACPFYTHAVSAVRSSAVKIGFAKILQVVVGVLQHLGESSSCKCIYCAAKYTRMCGKAAGGPVGFAKVWGANVSSRDKNCVISAAGEN
jgi:hypothetical protein